MNFGYKKLYINGSLQDSEEGSKQDVICPATGEKIAQIAEAGKSDAIKALNSARDGYKLWSKLTLNDCSRCSLALKFHGFLDPNGSPNKMVF